jgi:hypothetical protein
MFSGILKTISDILRFSQHIIRCSQTLLRYSPMFSDILRISTDLLRIFLDVLRCSQNTLRHSQMFSKCTDICADILRHSQIPHTIPLISRSFSPSLQHFSPSLPQPPSASPISRTCSLISRSDRGLELTSRAHIWSSSSGSQKTAIKKFRPQLFSPARPPLPQEGDMVSPSRSAALPFGSITNQMLAP